MNVAHVYRLNGQLVSPTLLCPGLDRRSLFSHGDVSEIQRFSSALTIILRTRLLADILTMREKRELLFPINALPFARSLFIQQYSINETMFMYLYFPSVCDWISFYWKLFIQLSAMRSVQLGSMLIVDEIGLSVNVSAIDLESRRWLLFSLYTM